MSQVSTVKGNVTGIEDNKKNLGLAKKNLKMRGGYFFFPFFFPPGSLKSALFSQKFHTLSEDDTRKYEDDMPGDLSSSYYG